MSLIDEFSRRFEGLDRRVIEIPEIGRTVYAKPYTLHDRRRLRTATARSDEDGYAALIVLKLENEDGTPAFERGDEAKVLRVIEADVVERLVAQIVSSPISTVEDAEKNSSRTAG